MNGVIVLCWCSPVVLATLLIFRLLEIKVHSWDCLVRVSSNVICPFEVLIRSETCRVYQTEVEMISVCILSLRVWMITRLKAKGTVHRKNHSVIIHPHVFPNPCAALFPVSITAAHLNFHFWKNYMKHKIQYDCRAGLTKPKSERKKKKHICYLK